MIFNIFFSLWEKDRAKILWPKLYLPNSEILADTVYKVILSLLIEFPIEQVIREIPVFDITYLSSYRKGHG